MNEKILIIDDEDDIISFLKDSLEEANYEVFTAKDGDEAIEKVKLHPDLILLDIMMPGKDGYEVCREIRDSLDCPIIFLTAKGEEEDVISGLGVGGDDYVSKPFSLRQLKARISAHLRRDRRNFNNENKVDLYFGNLNIDLKGRTVYCMGKVINLTKKEFNIIELLSINCGQVFSKEQIYEKIWGYDAEGDSKTVAEHVKKIRYKLNKYDKDRKYISTVWSVGYKWKK